MTRKLAPWIGIEVLTLLGFAACGDLGGEPSESNGAGGTNATGGGSQMEGTGAGASTAAGGSDQLVVDEKPPLPFSPGSCEDLPSGLVEPPCSAADVVVPRGCANATSYVHFFVIGSWFPPGELQWVVLPTSDAEQGAGGEGGGAGAGATLEPVVLFPQLYPVDAGLVSGTKFTLTADRAYLSASINSVLRSPLGYLREVAPSSDPGRRYDPRFPPYLGRLAILSGDEIVVERRLIISGSEYCTVK